MPTPDFRAFLAAAARAGLLRRVETAVDPSWEPGCLVKWMYQTVAQPQRFGLRFDQVVGADFPLVTGALGASPASYALGLGITAAETNTHWLRALDAPLEPIVTGTAACQQLVWRGADIDLSRLPVPTWTPGKDAAPYLTTITVTRPRDAVAQNLAVYRTQVRDARSVIVNLSPGRQGEACARSWLDRGEPAPIAWVIGAEPAVYCAAVANLAAGVDEITVAGGLRGAPVELVRAVTSDLLVPANAEIIIEGEILPGELAVEGPFGESAGYMSEPAPRPVARITAITHRRDAIYYGLASQMPPSESTTLQSLTNAGLILHRLRREFGVSSACDAYIDLMFGGGAAHLVVALDCPAPGEAREVGRLLARNTPLKRITLVDADIDIRDPQDLDWVMSSHYDPGRDTEIIGGFPAAMDHAVTPDGQGRKLGSKLVIDATRSLVTGPLSLPRRELMEQARSTWQAAGLPGLEVPRRLASRLSRS